MNCLQQLQNKVKSKFYYTMNVYEYRNIVKNGITTQRLEIVNEDVRCFVIYKKSGIKSDRGNLYQSVDYDCKVFFERDIAIKVSSIISVSMMGKKKRFITCEEPILYPTHCEMLVKREEFC